MGVIREKKVKGKDAKVGEKARIVRKRKRR